ncbi:energy transducer TonB [Ekhidna sp.]
MKKHLLYLLVFFLSSAAFSQKDSCDSFQKATFTNEESFSKYIARRLRYEVEAVRAKKTGLLVIDFSINEKGKIDSVNVVKHPHESLARQAGSVLLGTKDSWQATSCNSSPIGYRYTLVIEYIMRYGEKPYIHPVDKIKKKMDKTIKKGDYEKALSLANKAIALDEYDPILFETRASINQELNNAEDAASDMAKSKQLKNELITNKIPVIGYSMITTSRG